SVYVVLREQDPELARAFLRRAREAVFAFDRNVADPAVLAAIVDGLGRDGSAVVAEAEGERGRALLDADLAFARELGVRGFPTLAFVAADGGTVADPAVLAPSVDGLGRDGGAVVAEAEGERGRALLDADLAFARELGVRGFPTLVFVAADGRSVAVVGARGVDAYVSALRSLL